MRPHGVVMAPPAKRIEEEGTNDVHAFIQPMSGNLNALKKATEETERGVEKIHP